MQRITCPICKEDHKGIYGTIADEEKNDDDDFDDDNNDDFIDDDIHDYEMVFDNIYVTVKNYQSIFTSLLEFWYQHLSSMVLRSNNQKLKCVYLFLQLTIGNY